MIAEVAIIVAIAVASFAIVLALSRWHLARLQREADRAYDELGALLRDGSRAGAQRLEAADLASEVLRAGTRYNNFAVMYGNAANTFPALLTVPKEHRNRYGIFAPAAAKAKKKCSEGSEPGGGTRIMNPYMLWASGMAGIPLEDRGESQR